MIRTLRKKFVLFAMAAVTILLLALVISINVLVWYLFEQQSNIAMDTIVNSEGQFFRKDFHFDPPKMLPFMDSDIMRSTRFFIVKADLDGNIIDANMDQVFFVDSEEAEEFAETVIKRGSEKGRVDRYKFCVKKEEEKQLIFFLDMSRQDLTMRTLLFVSCVIAGGSWLISLAFVVIASKWVVQPIISGFEKQKQFITNAGHELKTPLAIIQSNNDAMSLIHGENKYNRNIKAQVVRLSELTNNLLMQARLDEEVELQKDQLNISELTGEIIQPFRDTAESRDITFHQAIEKNITMNTNREAFTQLLTVLMDNALKYTTDNGEVSFTVAKDNNHILITEENSCDPNMNINPERLFERFYRADSARTQSDQKSGYGIGLSVARGICESLGGKLTAFYPTQGRIRFIARF